MDWQTVNVGLATSDIAYLLGGCFDPDVRASAERELVESYRRRLVATGIDYDADTCWRDYRFSSLWGVAMTVIATVLARRPSGVTTCSRRWRSDTAATPSTSTASAVGMTAGGPAHDRWPGVLRRRRVVALVLSVGLPAVLVVLAGHRGQPWRGVC
ncbi:MAG: hypothetical protein R2710_19550 [Acidimicrobiales bacterium]